MPSTEAPLCRGVEPRCSGAEVTRRTLTAPSLFSGTDGGVQWGEMPLGCAPMWLTRRLVLVQNKEAPACACYTWEPGSHCRQVKGKPSSLSPPRAVPTRSQLQPSALSRAMQGQHPARAREMALRMSSPCSLLLGLWHKLQTKDLRL